jgi:predicted aminopeptidase
MRERKAAELAKLRDSLTASGHPVTGDFNNARLVAIATYERCVPALRAELDKVGDDLPAFYAAMTTLISDPAGRAKICPSP